jgi:Holliday junction resolvasome RuvABC endonuclease subunit
MIIGVDPSSLTIAVAVSTANGRVRYTAKSDLRKKGSAWEPQKAIEVFRVVDNMLCDTIGLGDEDTVYCEAPVMGRSVLPTIVQSYVSGIIQTVVSAAGSRIILVNNKQWKKTVVGNGNAKKEQTIAALREQQPGIERLCGDDDDLYDAAGLALFGAFTERSLPEG